MGAKRANEATTGSSSIGASIVYVCRPLRGGEGGCELICPSCGFRREAPPEWGHAVAEWYERAGPGLLTCPSCGADRAVDRWEYDPPYGFSALGVRFWNWPRSARDSSKTWVRSSVID
ncbi:uncharacterized protein SOCEGT47_027870 [Sorangium cellulosum]|uniref:Uncharacterized protein n=1 Tax=Sorangium cellulosum TaxID=56 RepID=A0A4P2Q080_SORCE|nr:hypothetical protein [Sorangium cellulosum]AUX22286.1 uncharacterized protein SOCEGT47_027870 [Sorangium cellulosum]